MLTIWQTERLLRLATPGRLNPWLGPALRGLAGGRLKAISCRHPVRDQIDRWKTCTGCPQQVGCAYGETMEPDPPKQVHLPGGWEQASRPLVIAPKYPLPEVAEVGQEFPVRVLFIGIQAQQHANSWWNALRISGVDPALGLGKDRILFDLLPSPISDELIPLVLPLDPNLNPGMIPKVHVQLTSPLIVNIATEQRSTTNDPNRTRERGRRILNREPSFSDLIRAGLRVLGPLCKCWGTALPESVFAQVKTAAAEVPTLDSCFQRFEQIKSSHRTKDRWPVVGISGSASYGPIPIWLLPWLQWAGKLHVGTHRIAGAGGWQVQVGNQSTSS